MHEIAFGPDGLERFSATFEQHCEGAEPALLASIAYRSEEFAGRYRPGTAPSPSPSRGSPTSPATTHEDNILFIADEGITAGYADGTYRPLRSVTRGQMAAFLSRALDLPAGEPGGYRDTPGSVFAAAIDAVSTAGIAAGYGNGTHRPDAPVTRGQMATFLSRGFDLPPGSPAGFSDTSGDPHEASIDAVAEAGIAGGYGDGTSRPASPVSWGQMPTFLARALTAPVA